MTEKRYCEWCGGDPLLQAYHDEEWGIPTTDDNELFERMSMQIFQAGLNWKMILQKRLRMNEVFDNFSITKVAGYDDEKYHQLLATEGIIRNRQKIAAVLHNAKVLKEVQQEFGGFSDFMDSLPAKLSVLQKAFKERFKFMGPEVTRMFIFNIGKIIPPHEKQCWRYTGRNSDIVL